VRLLVDDVFTSPVSITLEFPLDQMCRLRFTSSRSKTLAFSFPVIQRIPRLLRVPHPLAKMPSTPPTPSTLFDRTNELTVAFRRAQRGGIYSSAGMRSSEM
jgi:hypothetical protein